MKRALRQMRRAYGLTQGQAAACIGASLGAWSLWERGKTEPQQHYAADLQELIRGQRLLVWSESWAGAMTPIEAREALQTSEEAIASAQDALEQGIGDRDILEASVSELRRRVVAIDEGLQGWDNYTQSVHNFPVAVLQERTVTASGSAVGRLRAVVHSESEDSQSEDLTSAHAHAHHSAMNVATEFPGEVAKPTNIMIYPSLKAAAKARARAQGITFAEWVRRQLVKGLNEEDAEVTK